MSVLFIKARFKIANETLLDVVIMFSFFNEAYNRLTTTPVNIHKTNIMINDVFIFILALGEFFLLCVTV